MEALLDERADLLETLAALEQARARFTTKVRDRLATVPSAPASAEEMIRKGDGKFDRAAEVLRHRLLLDDSILGAWGIRPWEEEQG